MIKEVTQRRINFSPKYDCKDCIKIANPLNWTFKSAKAGNGGGKVFWFSLSKQCLRPRSYCITGLNFEAQLDQLMNFEGDAFLKLQIAIEPRPWRFFKSLERKQGRLSGRNRFSPKQSGRNISAETSRLAAEADDDVTLLTRPRKNGGLRPRLFGLKVALIRLSLFFNTF